MSGTKYSNNDSLLDNTCQVTSICEVDELLYSFDEFEALIKAYKIPLIKSINDLHKNELNYDPELLNNKSNYTLEEASRIAANAPLKDQQGVIYSTSLVEHYEEVIAECVKGQNQHGFHLITTDLWCHSYAEDMGECSTHYDNGTHLKISADVNLELTIISKAEFMRWCDYINIDTGLTYENKVFNESIEALKAENEKLKTKIRPQGFQQVPPIKTDNNNEKIQLLNREIEQLTEELNLLKERTFPIMTSHLKAALSAQKKYWIGYDISHLPLQKNVQQHIKEVLNIELTKDNRISKSLSVAIQPDDIKRK